MGERVEAPKEGTLAELREFVESRGYVITYNEDEGEYDSYNFVGEYVGPDMYLKDAINSCFKDMGVDMAYRIRPVLTVEQYVEEQGGVCPYCESYDIECVDRLQVDGDFAWHTVQCIHCGLEWDENFKMVGFD